MNLFPRTESRNRAGSSLIEAVIAVGVLAVAVPLVFAAIAESGKSSISSEAETRSTWIVPACLQEIEASRNGNPQFFTPTVAGETFPPGGGVWALGFSEEGRPVGKLGQANYDQGAKELDGKPIRYIASLSATETPPKAGAPPVMSVRISLEFPATSPATRRQKLDFYTHVP